jgi:glycosyltransferase involved in cell wall biosynthesis
VSCSILIPCYLRPTYLHHQLTSIARQNLDGLDYEIIVLNDGVEDETQAVAKQWADKGLNVKYLFTGQRNAGGMKHRVPGFCLNVGVQLSSSDIIILTCVEIYHLNDSIRLIIETSKNNPNSMVGPDHVYDDDGTLWNCLNSQNQIDIQDCIKQMIAKDAIRRETGDPFISNPYMSFFLAIHRKHLIEIGGYDEDFTGRGAEDHDLVNRLANKGCKYIFVNSQVAHLWHPSPTLDELFSSLEYLHNLRLFRSRAKMIVRNKERLWGIP